MSSYPLLNAFLTMFWVFIWVLWIFLLFRIITDIFRSPDLSGWAKTGWLIFVILLPFLGVFVYLIARGHHMTEHEISHAEQQDQAFRSYVRDAAAGDGQADQISKLADLRDRGAITDAEFQQGKAKILS